MQVRHSRKSCENTVRSESTFRSPLVFLTTVALVFAVVSVESRLAYSQQRTPAAEVAADRKPWVRFERGSGLSAFGVSTTSHAAGDVAEKRLTYTENGSNNNTLFRVNGKIIQLKRGVSGEVIKYEQSEDPTQTSEVTWTVDGMEVTERLQVVEGPPVDTAAGSKRFLNTVRITYRMTNTSKKDSDIGMRLLLDTLIGNNDGVPFAVPGYSALVKTCAQFGVDITLATMNLTRSLRRNG
jgi:hypothetical protein